MVEFNLLPYREEELKYRKKMVKRMLFCAVSLVMAINIIFHQIISHRNDVIRHRILVMNETLNQFKQTSSAPAHYQQRDDALSQLLVAVGKSDNPSACFTSMEKTEQSFLFTGKARSLNDVTEFLLHWPAAKYFAEIHVKLIEQEESGVRFAFEGRR
jgi:Tfp pilus assembly protein PilN